MPPSSSLLRLHAGSDRAVAALPEQPVLLLHVAVPDGGVRGQVAVCGWAGQVTGQAERAHKAELKETSRARSITGAELWGSQSTVDMRGY